jgi:uncharacterized protein
MSCGLAIFVKTPSLSPVKTRLAKDIGQTAALDLYELSIRAVASVVQQAQSLGAIAPYWAVAEQAALNDQRWRELPTIDQGDGGLGMRMANVFAVLQAQHGSALLIGADAAALTCAMLTKASAWLQQSSAKRVMGRAMDGGFWICGGNRQVREDAWLAPTYSSANTASEFCLAMSDYGQCLELPRLADMDHGVDLPKIAAQLRALTAPTAAQIALLQALNACSILSTASA